MLIYTPNDLYLFPSLAIAAIRCDECEEIHWYAVHGQWLWWGFLVHWT